MAVFIKATYVKKPGLPRYSSHQYSVEVSAELTDLAQLPQASADLYARLQAAVDTQIVNPGFVPGSASAPAPAPASRPATPAAPAGSTGGTDDEPWKCSERQRDLILKIVNEHQLDKAQVGVGAGAIRARLYRVSASPHLGGHLGDTGCCSH